MIEKNVIAHLFFAASKYEITMFSNRLKFKFRDKEVLVNPGYSLEVQDDKGSYNITFCEIEKIKITPKSLIFTMGDAGYNFKDGDRKILKR